MLKGEFYNHGADWWSLGILMHTLLIGSYPFRLSDSHTTMKISSYEPVDALSLDAKALLSKVYFIILNLNMEFNNILSVASR